MGREVLDYAGHRTDDKGPGESGSLARLSLGLALGVAVGEAILLAVVGFGVTGRAYTASVGIAAVAVAIVTTIVWVIAAALSFAAWTDRDGPRRITTRSIVVLAAEAAIVLVFFMFFRGT